MPAWTLAAHGDEVEKKWGPEVSVRAPLCETFWQRHVVPLTWRVVDPSNVSLRPDVPELLRDLALKNHRVFTHLAKCHQQLAAESFFTPDAIYDFYSRLYSVKESTKELMKAVHAVLLEYKGVALGGQQRERRLNLHGSAGLADRYEEAFETRCSDYRGEQVHSSGFPFIGNRMPRREYLDQWIGKGNAEAIEFASAPDFEKRVEVEFVDARQQASEDLEFVERIANEVWDMLLREIDGIKEPDRYRADQDKGSDKPPPHYGGVMHSMVIPWPRRTGFEG